MLMSQLWDTVRCADEAGIGLSLKQNLTGGG